MKNNSRNAIESVNKIVKNFNFKVVIFFFLILLLIYFNSLQTFIFLLPANFLVFLFKYLKYFTNFLVFFTPIFWYYSFASKFSTFPEVYCHSTLDIKLNYFYSIFQNILNNFIFLPFQFFKFFFAKKVKLNFFWQFT